MAANGVALLLGWALLAAVLGVGWTSENEQAAALNLRSEKEDLKRLNIEEGVKFYLITQDQPAGTEVDLDDKDLMRNGFDRKIGVTIIIHGYGHNLNSPIITEVAGALLQTGARTNVVAVDWGALCKKPFYLSARNQVAAVGARVAALVGALVQGGLTRPADVHIIGHSLGAHVAGSAGKSVKVGRITGLDPAQPLFTERSSDRLSTESADFVDVIHTCVGMLGYRLPLGHVDFYPNGGSLPQPGCGLVQDSVKLGHCSHARAYELYAESILNDTAFPATQCSSFRTAMRKSCDGSAGGAGATAFMGHRLQNTTQGVFFLRTGASAPFTLA